MTPQQGHPPSALVNPGPAAALLGVTTRTLINYASAGRLHAVRTAGGQRRYRLAELHQIRDQHAGEDPAGIEGAA